MAKMSQGLEGGFNFFLPLSKVEKKDDGTCLVQGYASTPALDLDGEIVTLDAVKAALPGYWEWRNIREMHQPSAVGVAQEANVDQKGLFLTAKITDKEAVQKCLDEVYKGFSIGGRKLAKQGNSITAIEMVEVSLVDRPANPECKFDVQKSARKGQDSGFLVKVAKDPRDKALKKMAQAVKTLAASGPPAAHDGFSLPAKPGGPLCKAHKEALCKLCTCSTHGVLDCDKCSVAKRDFSAEQRREAADSGAALPDGSFPIKNQEDLDNAVRLVGHGKNPGKARKHIVSRARALGLKLPDSWSKKLVKKEKRREARKATTLAELAKSPFLTLTASSEGLGGFGHGLTERQLPEPQGGDDQMRLKKSDLRLLKRMGSVGELSYCFDSLRRTQRSLLLEAKQEGGDMKDKALAERLGSLSQGLAAVISQKAEHEGAEALDLSDAEDQGFLSYLGEDFEMSEQNVDLGSVLLNMVKAAGQPTRAQRLQMAKTNMKKAGKARKEAAALIKAVHAMHKAGYLAKMQKAAKKPKDDGDADDAGFDHQGAMEKLQKAFGALSTMKTFVKAANQNLSKVGRSGQRGQEAADSEAGVYTVPPGVKDLTPEGMATLSPGNPGSSGGMPIEVLLDRPTAGKAARGKRTYTAEEVELISRAERAEARAETLEKMPATVAPGQKPYLFGATGGFGKASQADPLSQSIIEAGVNVATLGDDEGARGAVIGAYLTKVAKGRSVMDAGFRGGVVAGRQ